eukprot:GHRR01037569.1.p1 GENE.GHRR01037569.1~~GHRR01037569.1.p1  ORF type:complete len:153 (-),score=22.99 GHRR01037569.1:34-492(-)
MLGQRTTRQMQRSCQRATINSHLNIRHIGRRLPSCDKQHCRPCRAAAAADQDSASEVVFQRCCNPFATACSRRDGLGAVAALAAGTTVVAAASPSPALAAGEPVQILPLVPHVPLTPGLNISRVIKGCWQLSGGHRGEQVTDRTAGQQAIEV